MLSLRDSRFATRQRCRSGCDQASYRLSRCFTPLAARPEQFEEIRIDLQASLAATVLSVAILASSQPAAWAYEVIWVLHLN